MRRFYAAALALTLGCVLALVPHPPAQSEPGCVITVAGVKVCGELLGQPLPEVITVTVTPDPIRIPGPTSTVTVKPPPVVTTVTPPVETVTEDSDPSIVTLSPDAVPNETVTQTTNVSPSNTGQVTPEDDTMEPPSDTDTINFGDGETTIVEAGIGLLTLLALVGLLLLALYAGYILGYKDKERKDTDFMRALLDLSKTRRH